ncbi:MAG: hypothetical protein FVQ80_09175 [Planctomycetes bacterium]|nr:hypothetical protein [Planctomycetota bacterium]
MENPPKLKTFMSPVYQRSKAKLIEFPNSKQQLCMLDELLEGGIAIPKEILKGIESREENKLIPGLLMLLSGPPGSGKSTFNLELCCRLASESNLELGKIAEDGISSMYISSESQTTFLIEQAGNFGWNKNNKDIIVPWGKTSSSPAVHIYGREHSELSEKKTPEEYFELIHERWSERFGKTGKASIIVFDSLNVLPKQWPYDEVMKAIIKCCLRGPLFMIATVDTDIGLEGTQKPTEWDYYADLVIALGYDIEESYLVRKMQIVKARYQDHADGEHRLKINSTPSKEETGIEETQHPMSPYIKEGGIFVFPSIHRQLSVARRRIEGNDEKIQKASNKSIPMPFDDLNKIVDNEGLPRGYCTAIVGSRGGMKSHLAYYTLLKFLEDNKNERALIISLRDTEQAAINTLAQILAKQKDDKGEILDSQIKTLDATKKKINKYIQEERLEILYFWPGLISPGEFFHLVRVAVNRIPEGQTKPISLAVITCLEQLKDRFPLCAEEKMFVSGLVTMLYAAKTTSIVVSAGDVSAPPERGGVPAGLLQSADLILESTFQILPKKEIWSKDVWPVKKNNPDLEVKLGDEDGKEEPHVIYQIIRGPGARECRKRALFYMGRKGDPNQGSVYVRLLPEDFPYGKKI